MNRLSSSSTEAREPSAAREGGWGIVVVLAAHINLAISVGFLRCSGVLYLSWRDTFDTSAKETAAVQSILSSVHGFSGKRTGHTLGIYHTSPKLTSVPKQNNSFDIQTAGTREGVL